MTQNLVTIAYLWAAGLFILSLSGLSHPESARRGVLFGITGMALALLATAFGPGFTGHLLLVAILLPAALLGLFVAAKVKMTELPQLVAMLHSFVGAAAVLVGFATLLEHGTDRVGAAALVLSTEIYLGVVIGAITFTGSVATGRAIYALGAANLAELSLELGGKNAAVINDVGDLDACLDQVAGAAFMCAGQRCTAISRVIVAEGLRAAVEAGLVRRAEAQKQGDGRRDGVTLGPLTNRAQFDRVGRMVEAGVAEGARVLTGGRPGTSAPDEEGYFYAPTILTDVTPAMSVAREEIFGPVIGVSGYRTPDEAFAILNGVEYGLTSALFSNDFNVIQRFVAESESGMLHVNHGTIPDNHMPFGGIRNSGVGAYSVGASAANFYTTEHSVYLKAQ